MKKQCVSKSMKNVFKLLSNLSGFLLAMVGYLADGDFILYLARQYCRSLVTLQTKPPAVSEFGKMADFDWSCSFSRCEGRVTEAVMSCEMGVCTELCHLGFSEMVITVTPPKASSLLLVPLC